MSEMKQGNEGGENSAALAAVIEKLQGLLGEGYVQRHTEIRLSLQKLLDVKTNERETVRALTDLVGAIYNGLAAVRTDERNASLRWALLGVKKALADGLGSNPEAFIASVIETMARLQAPGAKTEDPENPEN